MMTVVNGFCLLLAFAFIKINVCIKVDPNGIANENYTTSSLSGHMMQPYTKSTIMSNKTDISTLLGDTELSVSERTRRLIPYMSFYVPVSKLPINKQYVSKHNIHATKQLARPSATGGGVAGGPTGSHIPIPAQYVHDGVHYISQAQEGVHSHYRSNAGHSIYHTHGYGYGGQQPLQLQHQQQKFHLMPPTTGNAQHLQATGPPAPPAASLPPPLVEHANNVFAAYKEVNSKRQKTVQYFPPLSSTGISASFPSSSSSSSAASSSAFETIRQPSSLVKQQQKIHHHAISGSAGNGNNVPIADAVVYRPRTKQSKIHLTPFTPSNTVPGNFVPIVFTPVNNNNNNNNENNNIVSSHKGGDEEIHDNSFNQDGNQQYHIQQQLHHRHQQQQPQQIALEYSSVALPPSSGYSASIPVDEQQDPHYHHNRQQQQQQKQELQLQLEPNNKQQTHFYRVPTSAGNTNFDVGGAPTASGSSMNSAPGRHHNAQTMSPPTIHYQNQHHHQQQQQLQSEHVIIDSSLRTAQQPHAVTMVGAHSQQLHDGKSAIRFQPPKPENFFESELQVQQPQNEQQQQQYSIDQVLKDVNSYSIKDSQMLTPQEKYVMYLQQRIHYNKHQQQQHATIYKNRKPNNVNSGKEHGQKQYAKHQQSKNPSQIFVLSSTISPPAHGAIAALTPIRPSQPPLQYDPAYPQHSPIHHELYPRPIFKPPAGELSKPAEAEEQVLTIPVHSLFNELETLQHPQPHTHYTQSHSALQSSKHKSQYQKKRPSKPQYIDYIVDEPKQSLDDELQLQHQELELTKPTLRPPSHAYILVTTAAPFQPEAVTQENYGSSLRPPYKSKQKLRLQPVQHENAAKSPTIRGQSPTETPHVVEITPTPTSSLYNEYDEKSKYVFVKEEFGEKLSPVQQDGAIQLKPFKKYEGDNNDIPQRHHHHQQYQQQQQQDYDNLQLQPNTLSTSQRHHNNDELQEKAPITPPKTILSDPNELPDIRTSSLAEILHKLQESNHLPHTLTPDNIDNSIKTLIRILNNLKQTQTIVANPPQQHEIPAQPHPSSPDYDYTTGNEEDSQHEQPHDLTLLTPTGTNKHPGPSTGRPGIDYPNYADIPQTSFDCSQQRYKGFFGDPETSCQVWHYCDLNGGKASFLCPNGTIFSQIALTCDWWFNVKCATTAQLYVLNERLYKYILPFTPKFPEDYSGPIVDKYLAMKFQEMEEKMRLDKEKAAQEEAEGTTESEQPADTESEQTKEENYHLGETTTAANEAVRNVKLHPQIKHHKPESVNSQVSEQSSERNRLIDDEVDDISQRGTVDNFENTTIATIPGNKTPEAAISFSLKPIIVSSTLGPDYDDDHLKNHKNEKRRPEKPTDDTELPKTKTERIEKSNAEKSGAGTEKPMLTVVSTASPNQMQITVEKLDVIEIKPDGATGHLIRDMLLNSKNTN